MSTFNKQNLATQDRRPWEPPVLKTVGTITDILQGGGGKLSINIADTGEPRKPTGQEPH